MPIASAAQQVDAGSSLRATLDRVIAAMSMERPAVAAHGSDQFVKAASVLPAGPAPSANAANGESGLTALHPGDAPPAAAQAGTPLQPSPEVEEHGKTWWWLHDHGLAHTKHERADLLRKAFGPGSGRLVVDGNGVPVNVEQLSDDEVIELDKKLRAPPYGLPFIGPAAPVMTSWGWHSSKPYKDAIKQLKLPGTHSTLNGRIPERKEAERMIEESGGRVLRSEEGHPPEGISMYHEPRINYMTKNNEKATVIVRE